MTEFHKYFRLLIMGAFFLAGIWIIAPALKSGDNVTHIHNYADTTKKAEYKIPPPIVQNNTPTNVTIYLKPDTALRQKAVEGKTILNESIKGNELDITSIDSAGNVKKETHKLDPNDKEVDIGSKGEVNEKKRTKAGVAIRKIAKRLKDGAVIVSVVYTVVKILTGHP